MLLNIALFPISFHIVNFSKNIYDLSMLRFLSGIFAGSVILYTSLIGNNSKYSDRQKRLAALGFVLAGSILGPLVGLYLNMLMET